MSSAPCSNDNGRHLEIHVGLRNGNLTFTDEHGNDADEKHVHQCDFLRWCTTGAHLTFDFPNGHPFSPDPTAVNGPGCGDVVRVRYAVPPVTKYSVTLTDAHGTRHTVDPKVIIDSGMRPKRPPTAMKMAGVLAIVAAVIVAVVVIVSQGEEGEL